MTSRYEELKAEATPTPWEIDTDAPHLRGDVYVLGIVRGEEGLDYGEVAICSPVHAALITTLANHADAIERLWKAADAWMESSSVENKKEIGYAVEALRDLFGDADATR